jgi:ABC-2 type transport system permease protein
VNWRAIRAIARKDIVDAIKNSHLFFALLLPLGLSLLFRVVFAPPEQLSMLTIAVHDQGGSRFAERLRTLPQVQVVEVGSLEELSVQVEKGATGGLVLPVDFEAAVRAGDRPELDVRLNERQGPAERIAFQWLVEQQLWALAGHELPARMPSTGLDALGGTQAQRAVHLDRFLLIVVLVMALAMTGTYMLPTLLVEEKEKHTLQALLVSPASVVDVVAGKAATGLFYSLLMVGVLIVIGRGWAGDWVVSFAVLLLGALFTVMVGLLMGSLFHTTAQVNTWSSVVMLALTMPSWFTIIPVPAYLQAVLRLIPTHYVVEALNLSLAGEAPFVRVAGQLAVLAGSVVVVFFSVVWALRRTQQTAA